MTRIWYTIAYLAFLVAEVVKGSLAVAVAAVAPGRRATPSIIALPLRCASDLEITAMASSITITPGTLVVGTAAADATTPPTLYVHHLFVNDRERALDALRDMEHRLLLAARGRREKEAR